ncbi:hypothetical protein [Blastopirellula retiformator]|uniref:3-keto-disaccharide hydrolase domain-containing protein n=1 Tax=Blastopirellula retiformator TaxID=2527970 RepID=A0A5C5VNK0_9BACT|nr:hypothetical protein [Blastopirellula retiformator]TWT39667.1 hypothetical protein Enr8_13680 [Blastopirellula retiformator]
MIRRFAFAVTLVCFSISLSGAAEPVGVLPKDETGRQLNLDFETGTLADWKAEGEAFVGTPIEGDVVNRRRGDMHSRHQGKFWVGSYERALDPPVGTLTSAPFQVTHPWAAFLHNGGKHEETRGELVRKNGEVFFKTSGDNREDLRRVVVDLRKLQGEEIFIRLIDGHRGGWGSVGQRLSFVARDPARQERRK